MSTAEQGENLPPFLKKASRRKRLADPVDASLRVEAAELYLQNVFLAAELDDARRVAEVNDDRALRSQQIAGGLQQTIVESAGYNRFLLRAMQAQRAELNDAYIEVDRAWDRGYLARVKEEALMRIEARRRQRENRIGTRAVNLIRGRVISLMTTIPQMVSSMGNRIRNIF